MTAPRFRVVTWWDTWHIEDSVAIHYTPIEDHKKCQMAVDNLNRLNLSSELVEGAFAWVNKPTPKLWQNGAAYGKHTI